MAKTKKHDPHHSDILLQAAKKVRYSRKRKTVSIEKIDTITTPEQSIGVMCSGYVAVDIQPETVNHPSHYGGEHNTYEAIKVIEAWNVNFNIGNTLKYITRSCKKGTELEDLKKAAWYLNREIENLQK